jgi:hypothetical protein
VTDKVVAFRDEDMLDVKFGLRCILHAALRVRCYQ